MSIEDITQQNLGQFTGTSQWYRYRPKILLTDGAKFLLDNGMGWFIDLVVSWQTKAEVRAEPMQFWTLTTDVEKHTAIAVCTDGGQEDNHAMSLARQRIDYTDCPLKTVKLYVCQEGDNKIILLPSEY